MQSIRDSFQKARILVCVAAGIVLPVGSGAAASASAPSDSTSAKPARPPNILVVVADDLGWNHIGWQNPAVHTPHLDKLATAGVVLHQHYVAPVCSPTRLSFLTGRYWSRFGCNNWTDAPRVFPLGTPTVASALKNAGYRTALIGKWHVGTGLDSGPEHCGFDLFCGVRRGGLTPLTHKWLGVGPSILYRNDQVVEEEGHVTDLFTREAIRWIESDPNRPFFLYLPFTVPHVPLQESERWMSLYRGAGDDVGKQLYWASISHMDDAVGQVMAAIDRLGQRDDTLVLFFGDNGAPGQHNLMQVKEGRKDYLNVMLPGDNLPLRGKKSDLYEGGIRTPAMVCWPRGFKPGQVHAPLHVADWMPTLCALAGFNPAQDPKWDGRDIRSELAGDAPSSPRTLYFKAASDSGSLSFALRQGDWKLLCLAKAESSATKEEKQLSTEVELYNLAEDAGETKNLALEKPDVVRRLRALLDAERAKDDDALPTQSLRATGSPKRTSLGDPGSFMVFGFDLRSLTSLWREETIGKRTGVCDRPRQSIFGSGRYSHASPQIPAKRGRPRCGRSDLAAGWPGG